MKITVYPPEQQGTGEFDGGKITEQKPIGFPQDRSAVRRVGPLFYWAWAAVPEEGAIGLHPHQGFEIMSYVLQGRAEHGDTLGNASTVGAGGAQVMQTGSGVSHQEKVVGPDAQLFQIWFEPELSQAVKRTPTYNQYEDGDFPLARSGSASVKTIIGEGSPIRLVTEARMWEIRLAPESEYTLPLPAGQSFAALAVRGDGAWIGPRADDGSVATAAFREKDFIVLDAAGRAGDVRLVADAHSELHAFIIQVPTEVNYFLYNKNKPRF